MQSTFSSILSTNNRQDSAQRILTEKTQNTAAKQRFSTSVNTRDFLSTPNNCIKSSIKSSVECGEEIHGVDMQPLFEQLPESLPVKHNSPQSRARDQKKMLDISHRLKNFTLTGRTIFFGWFVVTII